MKTKSLSTLTTLTKFLLPSAKSLAVFGVVPAGIFILYLPSCSGKTRLDFGTGTSSLFLLLEMGAATLRRDPVLVVELGCSLATNLFVTLIDLRFDFFI